MNLWTLFDPLRTGALLGPVGAALQALAAVSLVRRVVGLGLLRRRCPDLHLPDEGARVRGILYLDLDFSQREEVSPLGSS